MAKRTHIGIFLITAIVITAFPQEPIKPYKTTVPPKIDGVLDDEVWQHAPEVNDFKTFFPDFGKEMPVKTSVYVAYDRKNLYFGFKCFDDPNQIKTSYSPRDKIRADDWVCINLDSFNDQQSLYGLYINPSGIQMDTRFSAGQEDLGIDVIWYTAGKIVDDGYIVEARIPFKSLRYTPADVVKMGVIFERKVNRFSLQGTSPALNPDMGFNFLMQMQELQYEDIDKYTLVEMLPAVTYSKQSVLNQEELQSEDGKVELSLNTKLGITPKLTLDATINPDFSQVESDVGQININQRFALFFPERRPFFLEGRDFLNLAATSPGEPVRSAVYTRTIFNPFLATKLTGKIGEKNLVASILAVDERPTIADDGNEVTEKPLISALRYRRFLKGDSYLGMVYTGRDSDGTYNHVGGVDGAIRLSQASVIQGHLLGSLTQPDSGDVAQDNAFSVKYDRDTRAASYGAGVLNLSKNFQSDVGFITRIGITRGEAYFSPKYYPESKILQRVSPGLSLSRTYDKFSEKTEGSNRLSLSTIWIRSTFISASYTLADEIFLNQKFNINTFSFNASSQINKRLNISANYRYGNRIRYTSAPFQGYGKVVSGSLDWQASNVINTQLILAYEDLFQTSSDDRIVDSFILRTRNTLQFNKYLFFRGIMEYNSFRQTLDLDLLLSFTYVPGTVVHLGYGNFYERRRWEIDQYVRSDNYRTTQRGIFFKASYLFRL